MSHYSSYVLQEWLHKVNKPFYMPLNKIILAYDVSGSLVIHGSSVDGNDINDLEPNWRIVTPEILASEYDFNNPRSITQQPYAFFYNQLPVVTDNIGGYIYPNWIGPCWYLMPA